MNESLMFHFHNAVTTGVRDDIFSALWSAFSHTIGRLLDPFISALYFLAVWVPLHVINGMYIIFKFFAQGLMPFLFGTTINADGTIKYDFDWTGPLAKIMYVVLVISMLFFSFTFILSFTKNRTIDENGRPTMMQSKRVYFLKWPMLIVLTMIGTPIILTFFDTFLSLLLTPFGGGSNAVKVSQADMDQIHNYILDPSNPYSGSFYKISYVFDVSIAGNGPLSTALQSLSDQVKNFRKIIKDNSDVNFNGVDAQYLVPLQNELKRVLDYYNSGFGKDLASMADVIHKVKVGEYMSGSNLDDIHKIIGNLTLLHDDIWAIGAVGRSLTTDTDFQDAVQTAVANQGTVIFDSSLFSSVLKAIDAQTQSNTSPISQYLGSSGTSYFMTTLYGSNKNIGILQLNFRTATGEPFPLVQYFFTFITPDKNPLDWDDNWHASWIDNINWISAVLGIFLEFAMVMIMYNFVSASIKRIYLVVGYWIIGWVLMANGINNPQQVKKWYRSLIGQYFTIIIMFVGFQLAGIIFQTIKDPIVNGLAKEDTTFNWIGEAGMLFAAESAYQVAWQISQDYAGTWGAQDQKFQASSSMALTTGKSSFVSSAKNVFDLATVAPIRNAVTSWHKFRDLKPDRENKLRQRANNQQTHVKNELDKMQKKTEREQYEKKDNPHFLEFDKKGDPMVVTDKLRMLANPVNMPQPMQDALGFKGYSQDEKTFELQKQLVNPYNPQWAKPGGYGYALGLRKPEDLLDKTKFDPQNFVPGTKLAPITDAAHISTFQGKPVPPAPGEYTPKLDHNNPNNQGKNYGDFEVAPGQPYIPIDQQDPGGAGPRFGVPNEDIPHTPGNPTDPAEQNYSAIYRSGSYLPPFPDPNEQTLPTSGDPGNFHGYGSIDGSSNSEYSDNSSQGGSNLSDFSEDEDDEW